MRDILAVALPLVVVGVIALALGIALPAGCRW